MAGKLRPRKGELTGFIVQKVTITMLTMRCDGDGVDKNSGSVSTACPEMFTTWTGLTPPKSKAATYWEMWIVTSGDVSKDRENKLKLPSKETPYHDMFSLHNVQQPQNN